ncbi:MAG: AraC family ligand binding domain-containing protein, partial [Lachnospiraceae bacterium]|nr:AraC family ligand binding domain-containing protein [Lachnospiraceae bacterium]
MIKILYINILINLIGHRPLMNTKIQSNHKEQLNTKESFIKSEDGYFAEPLVNSNRIIYTPSNFAKSNLTFLQEVGELTSLKSHTSERENLSSFLFFIVTKGSGTVKYGNTTYDVNAGDCVFINCMNAYEHTSSSNLWTLKWV